MPGLALIYVIGQVPGVQQYQIVQEDVDFIRVRLVRDGQFPADGEERIMHGIEQRMGCPVRVSIDNEAEIPQEASGKFRHVVSQVARDREALL